MKKIILLLHCLLFVVALQAQLDVLEKGHDISRKARKGYLGAIQANPDNSTFDLIFVLKSPSSKIITETYTFDKDLNLKNTLKEEEELEKVKKKHKWFKYKGETYESKSIYVRSNFKGEMVFREKKVSYKWSWLRGGYAKKVKLGDKVKPKDEASGARYLFRGGYYENDPAGYMLVVAGLKEGNDVGKSYLKYQILQVDDQINVTVKDAIEFPKAKAPVFSEPLADDDPANNDDSPRDWIIVFAPQGGPGMGKVEGNPRAYTYFRYSPNGTLKEKVDFEVPVAGWRILGAYQKDGKVYMYGPGIGKDKNSNEIFKGPVLATTSDEEGDAKKSMFNFTEAAQATQDQIDARLDDMKYTNFQIARVNNQTIFVASPSIDEINKNNVKPAGQKKEVEFDGKRFVTTGVSVLNDGSIFVSGQDFKLDGIGRNKGTRLYKGLFLLQFDGTGKFVRNYGLELDQKKYMGMFSSGITPNMVPASSTLIESVNHQKIYWMISMCKAIDTDTDIDTDFNFFTGVQTTTYTTSFTPLYSIEYGEIDVASGKASDFKTLGEDEKRKFYLMPDKFSLRLGNYVIYLSETIKGDKVLFSRFDITK
ncbi:MAG: hypothetical protein SFU21_06210 [Flavihumibacter sp.]|nr:hypothetical protein [Flavihumibacter sp.]